MNEPIDLLLSGIDELPSDGYPVGSFSSQALRTLADAFAQRRIRRSAETGIGKATLLLSHFSESHTVFTPFDPYEYVRPLMTSPLMRHDRLGLVIGPSQRTVPRFSFDQQLDVALIDGPHAFPFPDIDYYFFYQRLAADALLVINNIHIPTVRTLFNFLNEEMMFSLIAVHDKTAIYRRTGQEMFDPECDGWLYQGYNIKRAPPELRQYV